MDTRHFNGWYRVNRCKNLRLTIWRVDLDVSVPFLFEGVLMALVLKSKWLKNKFQKAIDSKEKSEVLKILRSGEPIPPDFAMFVADILEGKTKFKVGRRKKPINDAANINEIHDRLKRAQSGILDIDLMLPIEFEQYKRFAELNPEFHTEKGMTITESAIDVMAFKYGVSVEKMKACVYGHRKLVTKKR